MIILPNLRDKKLILMAKKLQCSWIGAITIVPKPHCKEWDCHNNCLKYTNWYGGERVIGYYFLENTESNRIGAILHSVVRKDNGIIDITPFLDNRYYNIFAIKSCQISNYTNPEIWYNKNELTIKGELNESRNME